MLMTTQYSVEFVRVDNPFLSSVPLDGNCLEHDVSFERVVDCGHGRWECVLIPIWLRDVAMWQGSHPSLRKSRA